MPNLERRSSRSQLQKRAYNYGLAAGLTGAATVAGFLLALFTGFSFGWVVLLGLLTFAFGYGFKKTVSPRR